VIATSLVSRDDVEAALVRTRAVVRHTPLTMVEPGVLPGTVLLKLEQLQHGGTFGVRAVFNQTLAALERHAFDPDAGIATAAPHARHVGRVLGIPVAVCADEDEAAEQACASGALLCRDDDPEAVAGVGTIGLELWTQTAGQIDTVIAPPALVSGLASALLGQVSIVEAASDPECDLAVARALWEERRIAVDPSAASAYAMLAAERYRPHPRERVVVVLASASSRVLSLPRWHEELAEPAPQGAPTFVLNSDE
jgi:threonine dehydratase